MGGGTPTRSTGCSGPLAAATLEPKAVEALLENTQGYPYFIQLDGDRLWKGSKGGTITMADFEQLRPSLLADLDDLFFEGRYRRATPRERSVMGADIFDGKPLLSGEVVAIG